MTGSTNHADRRRRVARWLLVALYLVAGAIHIARPAPFLDIMPRWVPWPAEVVFWSGVAELVGALALIQPLSRAVRHAAAIELALYALCVWPANGQHMLLDMAKPDGGLGLGYHVPRMMFQPVLIWLALWSGGVIGGAAQQPRR